MDLSITTTDGTQHDLFGLFPGASGGRALRDTYGREHLITIARTGGRTTLERYGQDYMRELASRGGHAKRQKEDTQPRTVTQPQEAAADRAHRSERGGVATPARAPLRGRRLATRKDRITQYRTPRDTRHLRR